MKKKFIRRDWARFSKLGKKRKKKQVWRRAKGRDNKIREKRKGYPIKVMIGFKQKKNEVNPITISSLKGLEMIKKGEKIVIGRVGMKKRIEIAKKAKEKGLVFVNMNINKILKKAEKKNKEKEKSKQQISEIKKGKEKKK